MAYRIMIDGFQVESDTVEGIHQLIGISKNRIVKETNKVKEIIVKKIPKRSHAGKYPEWTMEHLEFLANNLENRKAWKSLPYTRNAIAVRASALRTNNPSRLSGLGKMALKMYNQSIGRADKKEYLPKV